MQIEFLRMTKTSKCYESTAVSFCAAFLNHFIFGQPCFSLVQMLCYVVFTTYWWHIGDRSQITCTTTRKIEEGELKSGTAWRRHLFCRAFRVDFFKSGLHPNEHYGHVPRSTLHVVPYFTWSRMRASFQEEIVTVNSYPNPWSCVHFGFYLFSSN